MRNAFTCIVVFLLLFFASSATFAEGFAAPEVPSSIKDWLPGEGSLMEQLVEISQQIGDAFCKELPTALKYGVAIISCALLTSILQTVNESYSPVEMAGAVCISTLLIRNTKIMFTLAVDTINQICEYEKLLFPVLTAAAAAQGSISVSSALYVCTSAFIAFLSNIIRKLSLPVLYMLLAFSIAHCALGDGILKRTKDQLQKLSVWFLKTSLTVYFFVINTTGIVSGTSDKIALKTTKAAITTAVPVIGSSLAEASEALLISAGIMKNAVGIYGIIAFIAFIVTPFLKLGTQYLILKGSAAICTIMGSKRISDLASDFSAALGLLLAETALLSVFSVISIVCYLKTG